MPYNPEFILGHHIPLPQPSEKVLTLAFERRYIHHTRHSLLFNKERGFAFISAHNIDGATMSSSQFSNRSFKNDPQIQPTWLQVNRNRGYRETLDSDFGPNPWDQGHLARRKSLSWGDPDEARDAERESDMWSNIAPQHKNLHSDAWGKIEDWVLERVEIDKQRSCVFTGPIFTENDPEHKNGPNEAPIRIPAGFWKVISVELSGVLRSAGFLVWQRDYDSETPLPFSPVLEQVRLTTIEVLTGLTFPTLRRFDPLLFSQPQPVTTDREGVLETSVEFNEGIADEQLPIVAPSTRVAAIQSMHDIVL